MSAFRADSALSLRSLSRSFSRFDSLISFVQAASREPPRAVLFSSRCFSALEEDARRLAASSSSAFSYAAAISETAARRAAATCSGAGSSVAAPVAKSS